MVGGTYWGGVHHSAYATMNVLLCCASNPRNTPPTHTQYRNAASHDAELDFFEIYMGPMTTLYSEVRGGGTVCKASVSLKGLILCLPSPAFTPAFTHTPLPHPPLQIWWKELPEQPLPPDIVKKLDGKGIAIVGYEEES